MVFPWLCGTALSAQVQFASGQFESLKSAGDQLRIEQLKEQLESGERVMELVARNIRFLPSAVLAVRNEMGMPLDAVRYQRSWERQERRMGEAWIPVRDETVRLIEKLEADARSESAGRE
jgi:hypothetical protein